MENAELPSHSGPTAPPAQVTLYIKVLNRACQILGGVENLATRLRVPVPTLYRWLDGEAEPPTAVFLKAVDIVLPTWTPEDGALARSVAATRPKKPLR